MITYTISLCVHIYIYYVYMAHTLIYMQIYTYIYIHIYACLICPSLGLKDLHQETPSPCRHLRSGGMDVTLDSRCSEGLWKLLHWFFLPSLSNVAECAWKLTVTQPNDRGSECSPEVPGCFHGMSWIVPGQEGPILHQQCIANRSDTRGLRGLAPNSPNSNPSTHWGDTSSANRLDLISCEPRVYF